MQNLPIHLQPNQPRGSDQPYSTPEQAFSDAETIPMNFPRRVLLTIDVPVNKKHPAHSVIMFPAGINPVPHELVNHWYLKAHGVTPCSPPEAA